LHGITRANSTPAHYARAAVEGMVCGLAAGLTALQDAGVACRRVLLVGGGAQSRAVAQIAGEVFGVPVIVPTPGEYVAAGAARQAAWALTGDLPSWEAETGTHVDAEPRPAILERYTEVRARQWG
jgi:xylulokinase